MELMLPAVLGAVEPIVSEPEGLCLLPASLALCQANLSACTEGEVSHTCRDRCLSLTPTFGLLGGWEEAPDHLGNC